MNPKSRLLLLLLHRTFEVMENAANVDGLTFAYFPSPESKSFSALFKDKPSGYWSIRQCLQVHSIINFIRFLISNTLRSRLHFVRGQQRGGAEAFEALLNKSASLVRYLDTWIEREVVDHAKYFKRNLYLRLNHDIDFSQGFIYEAAQEVGIPEEDVASMFPTRMQIVVSKLCVNYSYGRNCYSSLLDREQRKPWVPDMIDRRSQEGQVSAGCHSLTNSCREAIHGRADMTFKNQRCQRALAQESLNRTYDSLKIHLLGARSGGQILDTNIFTRTEDFKVVMLEQLRELEKSGEVECQCLRCESHLTFSMRVPVFFLETLRQREPSLEQDEPQAKVSRSCDVVSSHDEEER